MSGRYGIGDKVWWAQTGVREKWIPCPSCRGYKYVTVTFADGESVSVACGECALGYALPRGVIQTREWQVDVVQREIEGVELTAERERYSFYRGYGVDVCDLFNTKEEAEARAAVLVQEHEKEEAAEIQRKEKDSRTWAWNASYHRRQLKQAKRDLEYHTKKLNAALQHKKEGGDAGDTKHLPADTYPTL